MSRKSLITIFALPGFLLVLGILNTSLVGKASTNIINVTKATKAFFDPDIDQITMYQELLKTPGLSSDVRNSLEGKLQVISRLATDRADAILNPPNTSVVRTPGSTSVINTYKIPDGINNSTDSPLPRNVVTVLNSWRKTAENRYYLVYAGFLWHDTEQGVIFLLNPSTHNFIQYNTPGSSGGVRVIEERGAIIVLQSTKGTLYYFDAAAEEYVNAEGTPLPTNTPLPPTATPIITTSTPFSPYP